MQFPISTEDLCKIAGITPRQAQWMDEQNIIKPNKIAGNGGSGICRSYSKEQAIAMIVHRNIVKRRISRTVARKVISERLLYDFADWIVIETSGQLHFHVTESAVIGTVKAAGKCLVVDVKEIRKGLES